jgi:hypothetical protein
VGCSPVIDIENVLAAVGAHLMCDVLARDAALASMSPKALEELLDEVDALREAVRSVRDLTG